MSNNAWIGNTWAHRPYNRPRNVYRVVDGREALSTERACCGACGLEGWRGDFPGQGGVVADENGKLICDRCADES